MQIPIVRGRGFRPDEALAEARVTIVSAAAAHALWPGEDPVGKTIRVWLEPKDAPDVMERDRLVSKSELGQLGEDVVVVGVARDAVSGAGLRRAERAHLPADEFVRSEREGPARTRQVDERHPSRPAAGRASDRRPKPARVHTPVAGRCPGAADVSADGGLVDRAAAEHDRARAERFGTLRRGYLQPQSADQRDRDPDGARRRHLRPS